MTHQKKKHFGQHFLKHPHQAEQIADALKLWGSEYGQLLEIGPGEGMLTQHLVKKSSAQQRLTLAEIDSDLIPHLTQQYARDHVSVWQGDVLSFPFQKMGACGVIGNFPYNISSQIVFAILENRDKVLEMVGMFQKEVAMRIVAPAGSKTYGILSVLTAAYYHGEVILNLKPGAFHPPPKVDSTVIRLSRWREQIEGVDNKLFFRVVKTAFGQRRKTLRNSLKAFLNEKVLNEIDHAILQRRPEELGHAEFAAITGIIGKHWQ